MSRKSKREYLKTLLTRYLKASKKQKQVLLDEAIQITSYNRKYIIRYFNTSFKHSTPSKRKGPKTKYTPHFVAILEKIWIACNRPCSDILKALMPIWLPFLKQSISIPADIENLLLSVSTATIERKLRPVRPKYAPKGIATTRSGSFLRENIPIKTSSWNESVPGHLEVDTVAHCGDSLAGDFIYTLDVVDIATGWNALVAIWNKSEIAVKFAVERIEADLPFPILGWDSDNGSELLNRLMYKYFSERPEPVIFTRCRPYKKNDQAHVEQKNWSRVRQLLGYSRFDKQKLIPLINNLYSDWCLFNNFFMPSFKLAKKFHLGDNGKTRRVYAPLLTPYQRLLDHPEISDSAKLFLRSVHSNINPVMLKRKIDTQVSNILRIAKLP